MKALTKMGWIFLVAFLASVPASAHAFCGFMVNSDGDKLNVDATKVALFRDGTHTTLTMQNNYRGPLKDFAMVVPVPQVLSKSDVETLPYNTLNSIDAFTTPRLVEYFRGDRPRRTSFMSSSGARPKSTEKVQVKAQFTVGEYDVVMLSAKEASSLETWLTEANYSVPKGAAKYFQPYVQAGSYFFVAKVDIKKVRFDGKGRALLSPLRFEYTSKDFTLPIRLGLVNADGAQDLLVYVIGDSRYEVANRPNGFAPTNIRVDASVKGRFGNFYRKVFDRLISKDPDTVVTEYWGPVERGKCDPCPPHAVGLDRDVDLLGGARWRRLREPHTLVAPGQDIEHASFTRTPKGRFDVPMVGFSECARKHLSNGVPETIPVKLYSRDFKVEKLEFEDEDVAAKPLMKCYAKHLVGERSRVQEPVVDLEFRRMPKWRGVVDWTVTRLHARVDAGGSTSDLSFREAGPIYGGRQVFVGKDLERGAKRWRKKKKPDARLIFQSRFIIYHRHERPTSSNRRAGEVVPDSPDGAPENTREVDLKKVIRAEDMRRVKP